MPEDDDILALMKAIKEYSAKLKDYEKEIDQLNKTTSLCKLI